MTRISVISDLHCGHRAGLTPPRWWESRESKHGKIQRECWNWYKCEIEKSKPDILVVNGDAIDGKGQRSGGVEEITTDRNEQVEMAEAAIVASGAKTVIVVAGTAYHTGDEEDFEDNLAKAVGAKSFSGQEFVECGGVVFNFKHHVGSSSIPHGRHTAVSKERVWNLLWSERGRQPRANVIVRSHAHYFDYCGGSNWFALTTPALQAAATKYGRRCSGTVDFGFVQFDCNGGKYTWEAHLLEPAAERAKLLRV